MNIKQVAAKVSKELREMGMVVQRYDAYSTNSIYLKVDYGMINSIRISDHDGKKHLRYRFNILTSIDEYKMEQEDLIREYYPVDSINKMLVKIIKKKTALIDKYGRDGYLKQMIEIEKKNRNKRGFWEQAYLVK